MTRIVGGKRDLFLKASNIIVPVFAIGLMVYYRICDTSCSSLKGSLLGINLEIIGIAAMGALLLVSLLPRLLSPENIDRLRSVILAGGLGAEIVLIRFQAVHGTYCPYCLAFAACLAVLFAVNFPRMDHRLAPAAFIGAAVVFAVFFKGTVLFLYD